MNLKEAIEQLEQDLYLTAVSNRNAQAFLIVQRACYVMIKEHGSEYVTNKDIVQ